MDRITSSQVSDLMEAYAAVYAPQEITEEQVWEEVESWVNSLVEEGYDLSEYTWEDMYEHYLNEMGSAGNRPGEASVQARRQQQKAQAQGAKQALQQGKTLGVSGNFGLQTGTKVKLDSAATRQQGRTVVRATHSPNISNPNNKIQLGGQTMYRAKLGGKDVYVGAKGAKPAAPAAPAARPAAPAPAARPAAPAPAARPAAPAPKAAPAAPSIERRIPTSAELRQAQQARTAGSNLTGTGALAPKPAAPAAAPAPAATPAPAAKPSLQQSIRNRRLNMDLDLFDVIKGHLLDEGYADTEEAALKIMANMSEEWKQSILESDA